MTSNMGGEKAEPQALVHAGAFTDAEVAGRIPGWQEPKVLVLSYI
jgi:hypothetical protein